MDFESCNFKTEFKISVWISENINFIVRREQESLSESTFPGFFVIYFCKF